MYTCTGLPVTTPPLIFKTTLQNNVKVTLAHVGVI